MNSFRRLGWILLLEVMGVALMDQLAKVLVRQGIDPDVPIPVIPGFFHLVHWKNTGIAFGLFQNHPELLTLLGILALVIIPVLFWWEYRRDPGLGSTVWGLGMILGGALGNLVDRLRFGEVTDFLFFSLGSRHWPAFNVADACITIGTGLVIYFAYREASSENKTNAQEIPKAPAPVNSDHHTEVE